MVSAGWVDACIQANGLIGPPHYGGFWLRSKDDVESTMKDYPPRFALPACSSQYAWLIPIRSDEWSPTSDEWSPASKCIRMLKRRRPRTHVDIQEVIDGLRKRRKGPQNDMIVWPTEAASSVVTGAPTSSTHKQPHDIKRVPRSSGFEPDRPNR